MIEFGLIPRLDVILAQSKKAIVLLPLECVTCIPAHAHKTDRWVEMASFCLLILLKWRNWENMFEWGAWFMFWLLHSILTTTAKKRTIQQTWNVSSSASSRVIFYIFLVHFAFGSCCLDDNFDLRIDYLYGKVTASVSVGEVSQNDTDCFVCCLLTQQKRIWAKQHWETLLTFTSWGWK